MATLMQNGLQGNYVQYYRAERCDSTGRIILANGVTDAEAEMKVVQRLVEREAFLQMPLYHQLKSLTADDMSPRAIEDAVKVIADILESMGSSFSSTL